MAEEEKIEAHAKKALRILTNRKKKWRDKIKDFLWEILIIIVGVSITLWFHNWNDKRHEREQVKEFLISIRENLIQDTAKFNHYINSVKDGQIEYYDSVLYQINNNKFDIKYIDTNSHFLHYRWYFNFDCGLYQSFSASGNLRLVENQKLLSGITNLYFNLPIMEDKHSTSEDKRMDDYKKYIGSKISIDSSGNCKLSTIIRQPDVRFYIQWYDQYLHDIVKDIGNAIDYLVTVIHEIDKELKDNFNYEAPSAPPKEGEK